MRKNSLSKKTFNIFNDDTGENKGFYPAGDLEKWKSELKGRGYFITVNKYGDIHYSENSQQKLKI